MPYRQLSVLLGITLLVVLFQSCWKEVNPEPENPFKKVTYVTPPTPVDTLDPSSFVALQKNIFFPRCANPGCHDGHFEPDFRTLESSYSNLVYHRIVKNNLDSTFTFRVVPFDKTKSVLYERLTNCCFVYQDDRMPQDNIGQPLEQEHITAIENWIMNGARDIFGNVPSYPNTEPRIGGYVALSPQYTIISGTNSRIDSVFYNPFIVADNYTFTIVFDVTDDSTSLTELTFNKVRMSYEPNNFETTAPGYKQYQAFVVTIPGTSEQYMTATVNTADFEPGSVIYFRFYTNDGRPYNTEFPYDALPLPYKTFFSFYINP